MKKVKKVIVLTAISALIFSCGPGAEIVSTPVENIDTIPLKEAELTETEQNIWGHLDLVKDTIPGMSVEKAYDEILLNKRGKEIIVAVIDSGIDIDHEDLNDVIWTNTKEIPGNNIDDDKNGYVDDIHGWNFLGDTYNEQLELTRIVAAGNPNAPRFAEAKAELEAESKKYQELKVRYNQIYESLIAADKAVANYLKKTNYTPKEVAAISTQDQTLLQHINVLKQIYGFGLADTAEAKKELDKAKKQIADYVDYYYNVSFKGRKIGDNPDDFNDKPGYGNGNVKHTVESESHGTHVAGIIAAERNNAKGVNGVAGNVKIMCIRTVPHGDEYDKDVAKAIRYAVDNGAKIINGSFGKSYSPHSDWVRDAIKYASDKDVVFVHAAGNSSENVDVASNFPDDNTGGAEISNTYIRVGALTAKYGSTMVSSFSNYGKKNVDIFAPGSDIYAPVPGNKYEKNSGTSMAAPAVAGVAALLRSYYPNLSAAQVKQIILKSGIPITTKVVVGGDSENVQAFSNICTTGKIANAYNALKMAEKMAK